MLPKETQLELQRHNIIILSTIDYLLSKQAGEIVFDDIDPVNEYYQQQKKQAKNDYEQGKHKELQKQLGKFLDTLLNQNDWEFSKYIKEKTGYDIDIFKDLQKRINAIIAQNEIRNKKEEFDASTMQYFYYKTSTGKQQADILAKLSIDFQQKNSKKTVSADIRHLSNKLSEVICPNGERKLTVYTWNSGVNTSTYVTLHFKTASTPIFGTSGINPEIKAYWKNNNTIIIETKKEYVANTKFERVQSFEDKITIEYIET